ncbi:m7GpppX diphosphatase [Nematocida sp. AWRm77]|nr:m7GpppX diphosphatase [Nematocida sp. AWRm77]
MGSFEEFTKINKLSAQAHPISQVFRGEISNEPAVLILNKMPFTEEEMEVLENTVLQENDVYTGGILEVKDHIKYTLIHPATNKHILKYTEGEKRTLQETYATYKEKVLPLALKEGPDCAWVENIFKECTSTTQTPFLTTSNEKVLHIDSEFVILPDIKWGEKALSALYLLVLFKDPSIYTLRELTQEHLPLLERIKTSVKNVLLQYGAAVEDVQMYFHYYPTFYRAHLHVSSLKTFWFGTTIGTAVLLHDVVENIKQSSSFYQERTMEVRLSTTSYLYKAYNTS